MSSTFKLCLHEKKLRIFVYHAKTYEDMTFGKPCINIINANIDGLNERAFVVDFVVVKFLYELYSIFLYFIVDQISSHKTKAEIIYNY